MTWEFLSLSICLLKHFSCYHAGLPGERVERQGEIQDRNVGVQIFLRFNTSLVSILGHFTTHFLGLHSPLSLCCSCLLIFSNFPLYFFTKTTPQYTPFKTVGDQRGKLCNITSNIYHKFWFGGTQFSSPYLVWNCY